MSIRQALVCVAFLGISQALTMMLFFGCRLAFNADLFGLYANVVISFGGLAFGILGCMGAYPAARLTGTPPGPSLMVFMIMITWAGVITYQGLPYLLRTELGASTTGFVEYLDARMAHTSFSFAPSAHPEDIGRYGYIFLALDLAWATAGAFIVNSALRRIPRCGDCSSYFRRLAANKVSFENMDTALACLRELPGKASARAPVLMRMTARATRDRYGVVSIDLWRRECPSCRTQSMTENITVHNGKHFRPLRSDTYFWSPGAP